jgi:hypothetical protein
MRRKIRFEILAFICTIAVVLVSAIPLFNRQTDAKLIALFFGAFGAGVMLTNLIRDVREDKDSKR